MYDGGKIIAGLVIFLLILTSPVWYNVVSGKAGYVADPKIVTTEKECVESKEYMRAYHMDVIYEWRDQVVREGNRMYRGTNGRTHLMSLTNTCLKCHPNKKDFCDSCHNYTGVSPYCWDCHIDPESLKEEAR